MVSFLGNFVLKKSFYNEYIFLKQIKDFWGGFFSLIAFVVTFVVVVFPLLKPCAGFVDEVSGKPLSIFTKIFNEFEL